MYTGVQKIWPGVWDCPKDRVGSALTAQSHQSEALRQPNHQVIQAWQLLRQEVSETFRSSSCLDLNISFPPF